MPMTDDGTTKRSWKIIGLRALGWGIGGGIGLGLVLALFIYIADRPKSRDSKAFVAHNAKVTGVYFTSNDQTQLPASLKSKYETTFFISIDLENNTGQDVTLPNDMTVMGVDKKTGALTRYDVKGPQSAFLPAHHTTQIQMVSGGFCSTDIEPLGKRMDGCFDSSLRRYDLVLFDGPGNYEIKVPIPDKLSDFPK
jgi:hypothetical protein